jgi:transposase InsO family protein
MNPPAPTSNAAQPKAFPNERSSAASSATSPARSTAPSPRALDRHRSIERFIQTMLREWAYAAVYQTSDQRREALESWVWRYNNPRLHSALGHKPPISRLHNEDDS